MKDVDVLFFTYLLAVKELLDALGGVRFQGDDAATIRAAKALTEVSELTHLHLMPGLHESVEEVPGGQ